MEYLEGKANVNVHFLQSLYVGATDIYKRLLLKNRYKEQVGDGLCASCFRKIKDTFQESQSDSVHSLQS